MQPVPETVTVQRRPLDVEDYIDIIRRHRGWIFGPLLASIVIAVVAAFLWPDTYVSVGSIRVVPSQVPEKLVPTNVSTQMTQRINYIRQSILSRGALTNIISAFDLYPSKRKRLPTEDVIEEMRRDITMAEMQSGRQLRGNQQAQSAAIQIGFSYHNRYTAQKVTRDLMRRIIDESIRERANQSIMTTQFLRDQLAQAKAELDGIDQQLTQFRIQNAGQLPENIEANQRQIAALETRYAHVSSSLSRLNQEKLLGESELRMVRERLKALEIPPEIPAAPPPVNERHVQLERDIQRLERSLGVLLEQYKPTHPDVRRLDNQLAAMRKERDDLVAEEEARRAEAAARARPRPAPQPSRTKEHLELEASAHKLQSVLQAKEIEIADNTKALDGLDRKIRELHQLVASSPVGQQLYTKLMRDYQLAKQRYDELNQSVARSETATELENRKQGETLELLEEASLPEAPSAPNRPLIIGVGAVLGLLLGSVVVAGREMKDASLKNLKDVRAYTQLMILGSVPLLENALVVRRRRRLSMLAWSTACLMAMVVMSGSIYFYYSSKL